MPPAWFDSAFTGASDTGYDLLALAEADRVALMLFPAGDVRLIGVLWSGMTPEGNLAGITGLREMMHAAGWPVGRIVRTQLFLKDVPASVVPTALAGQIDTSQLLSLRHPLRKGSGIRSVESGELTCLFTGRPVLEDALAGISGELLVQPYQLFLAEQAMRLSGEGPTLLLADLGEHAIDMAIASGNLLRFCNTFKINTVEDAAYHLLNLWRHQEDKPAVLTCGRFTGDGRALGLISPYIPNLSHVKAMDEDETTASLPSAASSLSLLLNYRRCVS